eukprot:g5436.t1
MDLDIWPGNEGIELSPTKLLDNNGDGDPGFRRRRAAPVKTITIDGLSRGISLGVATATTATATTTTRPISKIDILSIDAEGHDPAVLRGARGMLAAHRVRYIEFEHHEIGLWRHTSLSAVVRDLDFYGFDCYWAGHGGLWAITGLMWHRSYDTLMKRWSNVVCVARADVWHGVLERLVHV